MRILALFLLIFLLVLSHELINWDQFSVDKEMRLPLEREKELTLFVIGDSGSGDRNQVLVARLMEKRCKKIPHVDGLLLLGDNLYPDGADNAFDPIFQEKIERPYSRRCLNKVPFYPVLGNHDYRKNPWAQVEYSKQNPRWNMPHRFYTVSFDSFVKLIAFDSNHINFCFDPSVCSLDFLFHQILNSDSDWTFAFSHHPLTSASQKGRAYTGGDLLSSLMRAFSCRYLDGWLAGHSHHLERRELKNCKTKFFVSGGGGFQLHDPHFDHEESQFVQKDFGFLELHFKGDVLTSRFFTKKGLVYEAEMKKH